MAGNKNGLDWRVAAMFGANAPPFRSISGLAQRTHHPYDG